MSEGQIARLNAALGGSYHIERELGEGGMATVYLATDLRHERQVALKVLRPDLAASLGPDRFLQEVRVTANLQHPHILPLFDSGEADGFLYYVMPFIDGESLRDRLNREGELPVHEAARLLRDVVDALATAHKAGVVHRDIKPENILLSGKHAMVADFGVAKAVTEATGRHRLTTMGVALGTPYYMSPEQASADTNIDHRADIYAVGAMAYELLSGRPPFTGASPQAVLTAQLTQAPQPVTQHRASVPAPLESMIMRCLEKKAADRWQSTDEMLPYLEAAATPSGGMTPTGLQPLTMARPAAGGLPKWALPASAVIVLAGVGLWAMGQGGADADGGVSPGPLSELDSVRVVVLPFENRTGDPQADVWGQLAAEETTTRLTQGAAYLDVPAQSAVRGAGLSPASSAVEAADALGARYVLTGRYSSIDDQVLFDADLTDAVTGQLAVSIDRITSARAGVQNAIELVGARAAVAAAGYVRPNQGSMSLRGVHPPSTFESLDRYWAAGDGFCRNEYDEVLAVLEALIEADPAFTFPRLIALPTYGNGGRANLSIDSLRALAAEALPRMTRVERLYYTWLGVGGDEEQLAAAQELNKLGVWDMSEYAVAYSAIRLNRVALAADAVERVPYDDPCYHQWPAVWSMRTSVHHLAGDHSVELTHAREAVRRFPRGAFLIGSLGVAAGVAGDMALVDSVVEVLLELPEDPTTVTASLSYVGFELAAHGQPAKANDVYARAFHFASERSVSQSAMADITLWARGPEEALPLAESSAEANPTNLNAQGTLGIVYARLGRSDDADAVADRIRELQPTSWWPAAIAAAEGDARAAAAELSRAVDEGAPFYNVGNRFIHYLPPFVAIADDPTWAALVAPRN